MKRGFGGLLIVVFIAIIGGCSTYKAKPLPFKLPSAYPNATEVAGSLLGAQAYVDPREAKEAFGFNIREAGMLPVQLVFDNQGQHPLEVNPEQTFLEDTQGNLWTILEKKIAYARASKYAKTKSILSEGGYHALLAGGAGAIIGAAVGIVTGENVAGAAGKGAAAGAAAGALGGGVKGYTSGDARNAIVSDLERKTMQNRAVEPGELAHGFIFFPGEALSAKQLRIQLIERDTRQVHNLKLAF